MRTTTPITRELARDRALAHAEGLHADLPRAGCPECEGRALREYPTAAEAAARVGPGRPTIGRPINVRLPDDLLAWADENARERGSTRAEFIREALDYVRALEYPDAVEEEAEQHSREYGMQPR
jgi:Ribbon-helix-helix protein, copG family